MSELEDSVNKLDGIYQCEHIIEGSNIMTTFNRINKFRGLIISGQPHDLYAPHENTGIKFKLGNRYRITIEELPCTKDSLEET